MTEIKFGTDGWRAVIGEAFTFDNLDRVAQATADYWTANPEPGTKSGSWWDTTAGSSPIGLLYVQPRCWPETDSKWH